MNDCISSASPFQNQLGNYITTQSQFSTTMNEYLQNKSPFHSSGNECLNVKPSLQQMTDKTIHSYSPDDIMMDSFSTNSPLEFTQPSIKEDMSTMPNSQFSQPTQNSNYSVINTFVSPPLDLNNGSNSSTRFFHSNQHPMFNENSAINVLNTDSSIRQTTTSNTATGMNFMTPNIAQKLTNSTSNMNSMPGLDSIFSSMNTSPPASTSTFTSTQNTIVSDSLIQPTSNINRTVESNSISKSIASTHEMCVNSIISQPDINKESESIREPMKTDDTEPSTSVSLVRSTPGLDSILLDVDSIKIPPPSSITSNDVKKASNSNVKKTTNDKNACDESPTEATISEDKTKTKCDKNKKDKDKDKKRKLNSERKNIRKIKESTLTDEVKEAQRAELERLKRISEKESITELETPQNQSTEECTSVAPPLSPLPPPLPPQLSQQVSQSSSTASQVPSLSPQLSSLADILATPLPKQSQKEEQYNDKFSIDGDFNDDFDEDMSMDQFNSSFPRLQRQDSASVSIKREAREFDDLEPPRLPQSSRRGSSEVSTDIFRRQDEPLALPRKSLSSASPIATEDEQTTIEDKFLSVIKSGRSANDAIVLDDSSEDEDENTDKKSDSNGCRDSQGRVLVNRGHPASEEDCFLPAQITTVIKPHQVEGIRFLYNNVVESVAQFKMTPGFGCILAHSMGLGKTIQVVSFLEVLFRHAGARSVMVIVPINTLSNWQSEVKMWLPKASSTPTPANPTAANGNSQSTTANELATPQPETEAGIKPEETPTSTSVRPFTLYVINENHKSVEARHQTITNWQDNGGVLLIGYEMFRLLVSKKAPRKGGGGSTLGNGGNGGSSQTKPICIDVEAEEKKATMTRDLYAALVDPGPQVVICDEGHRIKNSEASISKALKSLKTRRRVVMTGYPLQNNLLEYWCMVDFVRPSYLGSKTDFTNMFQRPIENGQCVDSTESDRKLMQGRAHVLHELLSGFVQRRSQAVLKASLPEKREFVLYIKMSPIQRRLYAAMIASLKQEAEVNMMSNWAQSNTLKTYAVCCKIWNHPDILWQAAQEQQRVVDPFDFDIDDAGGASNSPGGGGVTSARSKAGSRGGGGKRKATLSTVSSAASMSSIASSLQNQNSNSSTVQEPASLDMSTANNNPPAAAITSTITASGGGISYEWTEKAGVWDTYKPGLAEHGGKIPVLLSIIEASILAGDKLLVFSQSLLALDIMEMFLRKTPLPNLDLEVTDTPPQYWVKNETYYRLDGSTSSSERERLINGFNQPEGKIKLFLLSTRAGCLGINLIGANRVVVFDASWNPCHDGQAVCRVFRYGQIRPCFIYRLVTDNTMEKKIFDRQVTKQGMSDRVVDELNPDQHFTRQQVDQLLDYEDRELPSLSRDQLEGQGCCEEFGDWVLQATLVNNAHWITKMPFTHESLLIDRKEEQLTRAEKRMAKQSYEEEKMRGGGGNVHRSPYRVDYFQQQNRLSDRNFISAPNNYRYPPSPSNSKFNQIHSLVNGSRTGSSFDLLTSYPDPWNTLPTNRHQMSSSRQVKKVQASSDFYLTTSNKGPDGRPITRKILRGDTLEIYRSGKSNSWIRLAKTGEIFPSRPPSSSSNSRLASPPRKQRLQDSNLSLSDLLNSGDPDYDLDELPQHHLPFSVRSHQQSSRSNSRVSLSNLLETSQPGPSFSSTRNKLLACCGCPRHLENKVPPSGCICVCHAPGASFSAPLPAPPPLPQSGMHEDINLLLGLDAYTAAGQSAQARSPAAYLDDSDVLDDEDLFSLWAPNSLQPQEEHHLPHGSGTMSSLPPSSGSFMDIDL